jgi:hypothetical protein
VFVFVTNNFELAAEQIALIYKKRWQTVGEPYRTAVDYQHYTLSFLKHSANIKYVF